MKKLMNIGRISKAGLMLSKEGGSPLKIGLTTEPRRITGTRNRNAKSQYLIPTRHISNRLSINFRPSLPSSTKVIIIPAIEAERAEAKAAPAGKIPCTTRYTVPPPSTIARTKNKATEYLVMKLVCAVAAVVNLFSSIEASWLAELIKTVS
jgi:hypothetical protein